VKIKEYDDKVKVIKVEKKPKDDPELVTVMNELSKHLMKRLGYTSKTLTDIGTLHMPDNMEKKWFDVDDTLKLNDHSKEKMKLGWQFVSIPIFMPSHGRAQCKKCRGHPDSVRCNRGFLDLE
jgi:hypothetical protein